MTFELRIRWRPCAGVAVAAMVLLATGVSTAALAAAGPAQDETKVVTFFDLEARVPIAWIDSGASSSMRLLQMTAPGADSDSGAELIVYFFGQGQGGDLDANLDRWTGQFTTPDGGSVEPTISGFEVGDLEVTVVELSGTYRRDAGGNPGQPVANQTLLSAIVDTGRGTLFVQLHGPTPTVAAQRAAYDGFLKSIH